MRVSDGKLDDDGGVSDGQSCDLRRSEKSLALFVLAIASSLVFIGVVSALLYPFSFMDTRGAVVLRSVYAMALLGVFLYVGLRNAARERCLLVGTFLSGGLPVVLLLQLLCGAMPWLAFVVGYALAGAGQACLLLLLNEILTAALENKSTATAIIVGASVALTSLVVNLLIANELGMVAFMFADIAAAAFVVAYLIGCYRNDAGEEKAHFVAGKKLGLGALFSIASQTFVYGLFFVLMAALALDFLPLWLCSAFVGLLAAPLCEAFGCPLLILPSMGQRIISFLQLASLALCGLFTSLTNPLVGVVLSGCLMAATSSLFFSTSGALVVIESREFGYSAAVHAAKSRTPIWAGLLAGMLVGMLLCHWQASPGSFALAVSSGCVLLIALNTSVHRTEDPSFAACDSDVAIFDSGETPSELRNAKPFRVFSERLADEIALTPREREVYGYLLKGYSMKAIQETLYISTSTAKTHAASIYRKAGVRSKQELIGKVEQGSLELKSRT